ncbi:hypothetical protein HK100_001028 [Physocladia obscura]|uniref:Uncharacterized protein n=1 Tax=Physocladia obscura TaxID=109957 RepID=A0AAD5SXE2_9FUNG|nr:hypothetical protein HK100_001028 [Physocladia obscura]
MLRNPGKEQASNRSISNSVNSEIFNAILDEANLETGSTAYIRNTVPVLIRVQITTGKLLIPNSLNYPIATYASHICSPFVALIPCFLA